MSGFVKAARDRSRGILVALALVPCVACTTHIYDPKTSYVTTKSYSTNTADTTEIGEPIFDVRTAFMPPTFRATRTFAHGVENLPPIVQGMLFEATGVLEDGSLIVTTELFPEFWALRVSGGGEVRDGLFGTRQPGMYRETIRWPDDLLMPVEAVFGRGFKAELLYGGVSGETLHATYREYSDDYIRPAFSQELRYDISRDSTIAFRSIRIRVLEVTNSQLVFRITRDDNLPWLPLPN